MVILIPSFSSRRVVVSYKLKYVHEALVNRLVKLAQEKSVVRSTDSPDMTIAVDWEIKHQTKLKNAYFKSYLLVSSADYLHKQYGPRPGQTKCQA